MANFDATNSQVYFDGIAAFGAASVTGANTYSWTTPDPFHVITAFGNGFTYGGGPAFPPTGGTVTGIAFDWVDDDHPAGEFDATITGISAPLTSLVNTANPAAGQILFWETVLAGNDTINAPKLAGGRFFGDFQAVVSDGVDSIFRQGADDTFNAAPEAVGGLLLSRGDGVAANALIGDAQLVQGVDGGAIAFFAEVTGGDDTFNLSGLPAFITVGDVQAVGLLGSVTGGDDTINSSIKFVGILGLGFGRVAQYTGDVEANGGTVIGGDDVITGSNYAFAPEFITGDVMRNENFGAVTGGDDTVSGRGGQEMIGGDVGIVRASSHTRGGADLIRGGGDSDILAGDVLMFDTNDITPVEAVIIGGADRIVGDAGDDWISGDVWEITNAAGTSQIVGGADRLFGGDGDDQIYGDVGTDFVGLATANFLVGGNDTLDGGLGNDLLAGQGGTDTASFAGLALAVTVNLNAGAATGQGTDTLETIENVTGSSKNDAITGNTSINALAGGAGKDTISGRGGDDLITGGDGADDLAGDGGADRFDYNSLTESGLTGASRDVISGWDSADRIDAGTIDANASLAGNQAFAFDGTATPGKGEIGLTLIAGGVVVLFNIDGDADSEMTIEVHTSLAITAADFVL